MSESPWYSNVLWSDPEVGDWGASSSGTTRTRERLLALPDRERARQLIPWRASSVVASSRRLSDDRPPRWRWRDGAGTAGLLTVGALSGSRQLGVTRTDSLVEQVASLLGHPDARGIVLLGPLRANQKPVVQLHDRRGRTLGFVKIGWNELTKRLLDAEAAALAHLATVPDRGFQVPPVLGRGVFEGAAWLAIGPLRVERRTRPDPEQTDRLAVAVERTVPRWEGPADGSEFVRRLIEASRGLAASERAVTALVERHSDGPITLAASHGDFVPWNILSGTPTAAIWDWERYVRAAPVGFDRIHHRLQVGIHRSGRSLDDVVDALTGEVDRILSDLPCGQRSAHLDWYLADLLCRYEHDGGNRSTRPMLELIADLERILIQRGESA